MDSTTGTSAPTAGPTSTSRRRGATAAAMSSAFEWYDYFIFGIAAALIFGDHFFPAANPVAGVLASFATFAVGFAARPFGGIIAGHFGDKHGRKPMLVIALTLMGSATTAIGLLPSFETIGVLAPIALVLLRILQGIAVGAQWGGAMLMATEYAPEGSRGFYGSFVQMGVPIGVVLANSIFLLVQVVVPGEAFATWGWRIPFLLGLFVLGLAWFLHFKVEETPEFRAAERKLAAEERERGRSPLGEILRKHLGTVLLAGGSFAVNTATFYILITGTLDYATRNLGMDHGAVLTVIILVSLTQLVAIPWAASISDRFGRIRIYRAGAVGLLVWAIPMFLLIDTASYPGLAIGSFVGSTFLSIMYGPQAALFAELFSAEMRYTGASMGYQISAVLGGGLAPFIMVLLLESTGTSMSVAGYIMLLSVLALVSIAVLSRRRPAQPSEP